MRSGIANRVLLALVGLVLLALGGAVLAVGLGAPPPHWWIHSGPHDVLLSRAERTHYRAADWWWPAVIAALAVLLLLALWWLVSVLRRRRLGEVLVGTGDGGNALLRGHALETAVADDAARQPGVDRTDIRLTGRRAAPAVRAALRLAPDMPPEAALADFAAGPLARARDAAGLTTLPAEVRVRVARHRAERVT